MPTVQSPRRWGTLYKHVVLWHGCFSTDAAAIRRDGVDVSRGRSDRDFGRGFYTTTLREQAEDWARAKFVDFSPGELRGATPAVIQFEISLADLARLEALMFVRGDVRSEPFWSFVRHCRASSYRRVHSHKHPTRDAGDGWYDVVCGPVTLWPQRAVIANYDQFSFHTPAATAILNDAIRAGPPAFRVFRVPHS